MEELFTRVLDNLIERTEGPMNLRFYIQPTMSLIFAIRAGLKDAKNGTVPFLWRFAFSKGERSHIAREGWKDFGKIFFLAIALDVIYQLIVIYKIKSKAYFYPLESILVAVCLAIIPYLLFRGPVSRVMKLIKRNKTAE